VSHAIAAASRIWNQFWFEPDTPRNLAAARVIVAAHALWILLSRDYAAISGLPDFWAAVPPSLHWRYLLFPGHSGIEHALQAVAGLALLAAVLGVYPRSACLLAGVLLYHLAPLEAVIWSATPTARGLTLSPILLVLLGATRSGDALLLWPRAPEGVAPPGPSWEYGWPRRLTWLVVAEIYLFAAYAKLVASGIAWSAADNIRRWLLVFALDEQWPHHALGLWLAARPALCLAIGVGTVVFEWTFVLAVFSRVARRVLVPAALLFQLAIRLVLSIHVGETWLVLTFFDWDARRDYGDRVRSTSPAPSSGDAASSA